jgi:hypothetical protein
MKLHKILLVIATFLLLSAGVTIAWSIADSALRSPFIELDPTTLTVIADTGTAQDAKISIANRGRAPLNVFGVESDYSCTVLEWPKSVAPGTVASIRMKITPPAVGERHVKIRIASDSANEPYATAHVHVSRTIQPPIAIGTPGFATSIGMFRTFSETPIEKSFLTYEPAGASPWFKEIVTEGGMMTATLDDVSVKPTDDPKVVQRSYSLAIQINENVPVGKISGTIRFMSETGEESQLQVFGERLPAVRVAPRYISAFLGPSKSELPTWRLILSPPDDFELQTEIEIPDDLTDLLEAEQASARLWTLRLMRRPDADVTSTITVKTNHPDSAEIAIGVRISLRTDLGRDLSGTKSESGTRDD